MKRNWDNEEGPGRLKDCHPTRGGLAGKRLRESWGSASERFIGLLETVPKFGKRISERNRSLSSTKMRAVTAVRHLRKIASRKYPVVIYTVRTPVDGHLWPCSPATA
jgi:hypothetical protein